MQALLVLPVITVERLLNYMAANLKCNRGVDVCGRVCIFLVKTHKGQLSTSPTIGGVLREVRSLLLKRLEGSRDVCGFNLAAMRAVGRVAKGRREAREGIGRGFVVGDGEDIWGNLGLGSGVKMRK